MAHADPALDGQPERRWPPPLVSVIVPVYGVEDHLEQCVESLRGQSYEELEIILVDDGSPDRCGEMCDGYADVDPRIQVIHQRNGGPSRARNTGLERASGDLLTFVDADDWIESDAIEHLVRTLVDHEADIAVCRLRRSTEDTTSADAASSTVRVLSAKAALRLYGGKDASMMTSPCGKLYRSSTFDGVRFPEGRLYEDEFVTYRVVGRADKVALTSAALYHYVVREGSTTQRRQDVRQVLDRAAALRERAEYLVDRGLDETAAVSQWKALLLTRQAIRMQRGSEGTFPSPATVADARSLAREVAGGNLPLRHRAFAAAYSIAPRAVDRTVAAVQSAMSRLVHADRGTPSDRGGQADAALSSVQRAGFEPPGQPTLDVVVVAYGSPEILRRALEPVASLTVTVVDNSSLPAIRQLAAELGCRYIDPGHNGGFAAGVNVGLANRQSPGSDVLLLNPDATISPDDVLRLHHVLRSSPDLASVGPAQVDALGNPSRVTWPFPSPTGTWMEALGLHRLRRRAPTYVIGSILLLRAEAIADVGAFDERFFLYAEEADWAYRAHRRGWRHALAPDVRAIHIGGATSSDESRRTAHFHGSQERYLRKHYGAAGWHTARWGQVLGDSLRILLRPGPARHRLKQRVGLYRRGPAAVEASFTAPFHSAPHHEADPTWEEGVDDTAGRL